MREGRKIFKFICLILTLAIVTVGAMTFAGCSSARDDYAPQKVREDLGVTAMDNLRYLAANHPDRTMGTQGEYDAAAYLADTLKSYGYESRYAYDGIEGLQDFKSNFTRYDGTAVNEATSYNVVFTKKSSRSEGEIILSAQYDNLYSEKKGEELWKADGSYESGSGASILLTLAETMKDREYEYDITFVFFTGGSYRWRGSYHYASQLKNADYDNIRLMINFSMLGGGDNLYLYSGERANNYGNYLRAASEGLSNIPKNKNCADYTMETDAAYPYTHIGMSGNQYHFINRGVPTANYLSHNWSLNDYPMLTEMDGKNNVYHTESDTLENMIERKGEENIIAQFDNVVNSVLSALDASNGDTFKSVLSTAKNEVGAAGQSTRVSTVLEVVLKIAAIGAVFGLVMAAKHYIIKHRSDYLKPAEESKEESVKPFDFQSYPDEKSDGESDASEEKTPSDDPFL